MNSKLKHSLQQNFVMYRVEHRENLDIYLDAIKLVLLHIFVHDDHARVFYEQLHLFDGCIHWQWFILNPSNTTRKAFLSSSQKDRK